MRARGEPDAFAVPHAHFWCRTEDGVRIAGSALGPPSEIGVVLAHGFLGYRTKPAWRLLAEVLAERFRVYAFDLRGHGQSGGSCSGGELESLDVRAVVQHARAHGQGSIVTVGGSLGGIAVLGEASSYRDVEAVVAISTPALWGTSTSKAVRRMTWLFTSRVGRALALRLMGTKIHLTWNSPDPPADVVGSIAPIPLLVVHGDDDHFFPVSDAEMLFARAGEPKRLLILPGFGHAEDGFTRAFASQLAIEIDSLLAAREREQGVSG